MHADKYQSFCKLVLFFLMEGVRHVQTTQNRKLVIFLQYIKKTLKLLLCVYCNAKHLSIVMQNIQIFYGGPVMFLVNAIYFFWILSAIKMKYGQISVCCMTKIYETAWDLKLVLVPFIILLKWQYSEIRSFLVADDFYRF